MISPSHIAIIMDGNGRWGLKKYNDRNKGHYYGLLNINKVIEHCIKIKIKYFAALQKFFLFFLGIFLENITVLK